MAAYRILFVCWGNICRSPTAEGIMRRLVADAGLEAEIEVDSAGVSNEHAGQEPDWRSQAEAVRRGLDLTKMRARQVTPLDWERYDLLLVTDDSVERRLRRQAPRRAPLAKVHHITDFVSLPTRPSEVPDPYYGGADGFRLVYDLLEDACAGILAHARDQAGLPCPPSSPG